MMSFQRNEFFRSPAARPPEMLDPVVEEALIRQVVTNKQVADAWLKRRTMYRSGKYHPVWRWLAEQEDVDRDEIFRIAAKEYDYKRLDLPLEDLKVFVSRIIPCFSAEQWNTLLRVGLVPVRRTSPRGISFLWNFAANDPTQKSIHHVARQLVGSHYELYQADRKLVATLLGEVYLIKMELPGRSDMGNRIS